jgi:hypothetical protein
MKLRNYFLLNPIIGVQQMIDFANDNLDGPNKVQIRKAMAEALFTGKFDESVLTRLYDKSRYELFQYYKTTIA